MLIEIKENDTLISYYNISVSGNILSTLTSGHSPDNVQIVRAGRALPSLAGAAINYQEFVQDKQGKEVKKPEKKKEIKTRPVKSYL